MGSFSSRAFDARDGIVCINAKVHKILICFWAALRAILSTARTIAPRRHCKLWRPVKKRVASSMCHKW